MLVLFALLTASSGGDDGLPSDDDLNRCDEKSCPAALLFFNGSHHNSVTFQNSYGSKMDIFDRNFRCFADPKWDNLKKEMQSFSRVEPLRRPRTFKPIYTLVDCDSGIVTAMLAAIVLREFAGYDPEPAPVTVSEDLNW